MESEEEFDDQTFPRPRTPAIAYFVSKEFERTVAFGNSSTKNSEIFTLDAGSTDQRHLMSNDD